jgi:hypothetical protein
MTKYLVLYRSSQSALDQMAQATPEQAEAGMQEWMAWAGRAGGAVVDLGTPLAPLSDVQGESVGGYSILQAESDDAVNAVLEGHPHAAQGGTIEVHRFLDMPGM